MGPSGSGRSSLLTIGGTLLEEPTSGAVLVNGEDTLRMSGGAKSQTAPPRHRYVFQDFNLLPGLTAAENLSLPLELDGTSMRKAHLARSRRLASSASATRRGHFPDQMSGGGQQRVAIAHAVVEALAAPCRRAVRRAPTPRTAKDRDAAHPQLLPARGTAAVVVAYDAQLASWAGPYRVPARRPAWSTRPPPR